MPLKDASLLAKIIVGGALEEISLETLMKEAKIEVEEQRKAGVSDEKKLTEAVEKKIKETGNSIKNLV